MSAEELPDNILFTWYRNYIGEPDARADVYIGFGLFFVGLALALAALLTFLWAATFERGSVPYYLRTGPAFAMGLLALPAALLGIVVSLPVKRRAVFGAALGSLVTLAGVGLFTAAYPNNINQTASVDYTVHVVVIYGIGLAIEAGVTGTALVAYHLERAKPSPAAVEARHEPEEEVEDFSEEEIRKDIEDAMQEVNYSLGGVKKHKGKSLNVDMDLDTDGATLSGEGTTTARSSGVDEQVQGLKGLTAGEKNTATSDITVDDQTQKLTELKERKENEEIEEVPGSSGGGGVLGRIKGLFG